MKKFCSLLLAFVLVLSIFPILKPEVSATSKNANEAISWCQSQIGKSLDYDGNGYWCVDLIAKYYQFLGAPTPGGNACDYATNSLPSGWVRTKGGTPQKGDIIIWAGGSGVGHIVIYESDNVTYHQRYSGQYVEKVTQYYKNIKAYDGAGYWGCIHPNFSNSSSPTINYVTGLAGTYYLQSKNTGYHLAVSEGKDASLQPINTWGTWWSNFKVKLTAQGNAYKITFPEVSSLLVNPYSDTPANGTKINLYKDVNDSSQWWGFEKVGDAYVIRCMYNPSLVLTENGTGQATLTTYNGSAKQLWYLRSHVCGLVSYNANGGSGAPASQSKYYNVTLSLHTTKPTRSGYTFLGWATSPTATSVAYSAGAAYSANSGVTLYAVWQKNHAHSYTGTVTKAPTCTQPGVRTYKCSCGASYTQSIPSTGHTKSEWIIDVSGTGNSAGSKHKECTKCGAVLETTVIPQLKPVTPEITSVTNSTNGVKVIWGKASGADSYIVYRRAYNATTKKWSGWSRLADGVTSTSYVDKTAKSGTYYRYTIKATNEAGYSGYNTSGVKTYFLSRPQVTSTSNNNSGINIKWNKVTGANGYVVYRKTTGGWTKVATVKGNGTVSYTDKTATAGVTYRYTIRAYYGSYLSSFVVNGYAVRRLTTPSLKSVTSAQRGITLKWNKVTGATGYIVYRKSDNGSWQNMGKITGTTVVDTSAKKGVTYTYTVRAYYGTSTSYYNTKGLTIKDKY